MNINSDDINLNGELVFTTVSHIAPQFVAQIQQSSALVVEVNMSNVSKADSSALALMLEGLKCALKLDKKLSYKNIPTNLLNLAKFCSLEDLILNKE